MARCKWSTRLGSPSGPVTFKTDAYHHLRTSDPFRPLLKLLVDHSSIVKENPKDLAARYKLVVPALKLHFKDIDALHAPDDLIQLFNPLHQLLAHLGRHAESTWFPLVYPVLTPNEIHELLADWDFPDLSDPRSLKIARSPGPTESLDARAYYYGSGEMQANEQPKRGEDWQASSLSSVRSSQDSVDKANIVTTVRSRTPTSRKREADQMWKQRGRARTKILDAPTLSYVHCSVPY
ncbi:hypothetical protein B0H14DRAFT_3910045, partial [Mycena olivaceomarginata]